MEGIIEALMNEVQELKPCVQRENLIQYCNELYGAWENLETFEEECNRLEKENDVLRKLLFETLSPEDRRYIRIKYDIEV